MKYRVEVVCDKCEAHYMTIKIAGDQPTHCKVCGSIMIRPFRRWLVDNDYMPPEIDYTRLNTYTTKQLKYLLSISGCKGEKRELVVRELMFRPEPTPLSPGRPKGKHIGPYKGTPPGRPKGSTKKINRKSKRKKITLWC